MQNDLSYSFFLQKVVIKSQKKDYDCYQQLPQLVEKIYNAENTFIPFFETPNQIH